MKRRYRVIGQTTVTVITVVEADSPEDALIVAGDELNCLISYVGSGGSDTLVGFEGEDGSVSADEEIEWTSAVELEAEDDGDG